MNGRTDIYFQEKGIFAFAEIVDNRWKGNRDLNGEIPQEIRDDYFLAYNFAAYRAAKDQKKKMSIAVKKQKAESTWSINANEIDINNLTRKKIVKIFDEAISTVRSNTPRFPYPSEAVLVLLNGEWSCGLIPLNSRPSFANQILKLPVYLVFKKKIEFCYPEKIYLIPPGSPILNIPIEPVPFGLMPPISPKFTKGHWGRIQILFDWMSKWKSIGINEEVEGEIIYIDKPNRYCGITANTTYGSQAISELLSRLWNELDPIVEEDMEDRQLDDKSECYKAAEFTSYTSQKTFLMRVKILKFANDKKTVIAMDIDSGKIYHPECSKLKMLPEELHPKNIAPFVTIGRFPKNTKKHLLEPKKIVSVTAGCPKDYNFYHKEFYHLKKMQYKQGEAFGSLGLKFAIHLHDFKIEENEEDFLNFLDSEDEIDPEKPAEFINLKKKITKKSPWLVSESLSHSLDCEVQMSSHQFHNLSNEIRELLPTLEDSVLEDSALIQICHVQTHHLMAVFVLQHPYKKREEGEKHQLNTQTDFHQKIQDRIYEEDLEVEEEDELVLVRTNLVTEDKFMYYRALVLERDDFKSKGKSNRINI